MIREFVYLNKKGKLFRTDCEHNRDYIKRHQTRWPRRIQSLVWHEIIYEEYTNRIIAITRNICPIWHKIIIEFLPKDIVNLVVQYTFRQLVRL